MNEIKADDSGESMSDLILNDSIELLHQRWQDILSRDIPQFKLTNIDIGLCISIDTVIDAIAILGEQSNEMSYFQSYFSFGVGCYPSLQTGGMYEIDWQVTSEESCGVALPSQERIKELNQYIYEKGNHPPKLSPTQIQEITADYPFQFPIEFCKLYQRANGIFHIGIGNKDWNSFTNYFGLAITEWEEPLLDLKSAMHMYQVCSTCEVDSRLFPLVIFESNVMWAVMGSEEQKDISPIYAVSLEGGKPGIIWSSLAEMLSAWLYQRNTKQD